MFFGGIGPAIRITAGSPQHLFRFASPKRPKLRTGGARLQAHGPGSDQPGEPGVPLGIGFGTFWELLFTDRWDQMARSLFKE